MSELAILGGKPAVRGELKPFCTIGDDERRLVGEVLDSGMLSGFYGSWGDKFLGGPMVRRLEADWMAAFNCKFAVTVNSNTSGLMAAMGAVGISPGDEVIVPPYTMSATAMAPLIWGGVPVFVDIESDTFCLDVNKVREAITERTKAILVVNLFGHPARLAELRALADERGIFLIEDNAQGPFAAENDQYAGTIGHIGVFSLNVHKHIQTGEGGVCVTNDPDLAQRLQISRNHGENVVEPLGRNNIVNLLGFNFRMTELTAAVGVAQLARGRAIVDTRIAIAERLSAGLSDIPGLSTPAVRKDCSHVYYLWAATIDETLLGLSRNVLLRALEAEGVPLYGGYVPPLYRLPVFRQRVALGRNGFPFNLSDRVYHDGLCPVAERLHEQELFAYEVCGYEPTPEQLQQMVDAFHKVIEGRHKLRDLKPGS